MSEENQNKLIYRCAVCDKKLEVGLHEGLPKQLHPIAADLVTSELLPMVHWGIGIDTVKLQVQMTCSDGCRAKAAEDQSQARALRESVGDGKLIV